MYPIDLLKVRRFPSTVPMPSELCANPTVDQDAGRQPLARRHVYRNFERHDHNLESGRISDIMERAFERCIRSRWVCVAQGWRETRLTTAQDPRMPSTLHPTKL